jgi:hypothetical protein
MQHVGRIYYQTNSDAPPPDACAWAARPCVRGVAWVVCWLKGSSK